ncbi:MAG: hypothetical protein HZB64_00210 [Rhodocyclales bacterium]|nr:hypothetical protein [Rhodocyclales bacterium]
MSLPENYGKETAQIELEIERKGVILGIDWNDAAQVRQLAHDAFHCRLGQADCDVDHPLRRARVELFALAQLMLAVMTESAENGVESHGGAAWKIFARALWLEKESAATDKTGAPPSTSATE